MWRRGEETIFDFLYKHIFPPHVCHKSFFFFPLHFVGDVKNVFHITSQIQYLPFSFINTLFNILSLYTFFMIAVFTLFKVQKPLSLALLSVACFIIITVLISLQFPVIMSSPWAALSFAACFTAILGSAATFVGDEIAPLPLYALIMV